MLVTYVRPFSGRSGRTISPAGELSRELREIHEDIMSRRHRVYAHTDHTDIRQIIDIRAEDGLAAVLRDTDGSANVREQWDSLTENGFDPAARASPSIMASAFLSLTAYAVDWIDWKALESPSGRGVTLGRSKDRTRATSPQPSAADPMRVLPVPRSHPPGGPQSSGGAVSSPASMATTRARRSLPRRSHSSHR